MTIFCNLFWTKNHIENIIKMYFNLSSFQSLVQEKIVYISIEFDGLIIWKTVDITMGTYCEPLWITWFCTRMELNSNRTYEKTTKICKFLEFHISPSELEIKDTTKQVVLLHILIFFFNSDTERRLQTKI